MPAIPSTSHINIRNLGSQRTQVLINGRRWSISLTDADRSLDVDGFFYPEYHQKFDL